MRLASKGKRISTAEGVRIAGKNANGDGSIYESGGRWFATYTDPEGKRRRVSAQTRPLVRQRLADKLAQLDRERHQMSAGPLGHDPTVATMVQWWLDNVMDVRPNTEVSYRNQADKIVAHLGTVRVADFDAAAVSVFLADLKRDEMSDHTITNIRARLRQIAEAGVRLGVLARNPVTDVKPPRTGRPKRKTAQRTLTHAEALAMLDECESHPLGAAVALLFTNGIRGAEALGLAWSDVDFDAATITIRRSSTFAGKGVGQVIGPPKTERTRGTLALTSRCVDLLRLRKATQDAEKALAGDLWRTTVYDGQPLDLIFTTDDGRPKYTQHLNLAVKALASRAGLSPHGIGTHAGRRTVITVLYAQGVDTAQIRRFVGHADVSTTEGYIRDYQRRDADTDAVVATLFDGNDDPGDGRSAAADRARDAHRRLSPVDRLR